MSGYTQLTREPRYQIQALLNSQQNQISRELRRNRGRRGYRPHQAQGLAQARQVAKRHPRLAPAMWQQVETLLRQAWSPEQLPGRLEHENGQTISHEWIYQHSYRDKRTGGDLYRSLRCQKRRRKRYGTYNRRGRIANQVSIAERPPGVNARKRLCDWEGYTVIGKGHSGVLVTVVERTSQYTVLQCVSHKTATAVRKAVVRGLQPHKAQVHTIAYDNVL